MVIPLYNEEDSLVELFEWIKRVLDANGYSFEVVFVDDGSNDASWERITALASDHPEIVGIKFRRNYGKSAGLNRGFDAARGNVVFTMDADLQDSPEELPEMYRMITEDGFDLVSGWKKKRFDRITKTVPTKIFNWATRVMSGISLNDFNCGLKAYRGQVVKSIEVHGEMHRYIPVIAKWAGFSKIGEKVVQHQERKYGVTKFGLERFIFGFLDLLSISFISQFGKRPMHLFGLMGTLMFGFGFIASTWLGADKIYSIYYLHEQARLITEQPVFYIALVTMILGTQLFLAGFLAELISRNSPDRNSYLVEKRVGLHSQQPKVTGLP